MRSHGRCVGMFERAGAHGSAYRAGSRHKRYPVMTRILQREVRDEYYSEGYV